MKFSFSILIDMHSIYIPIEIFLLNVTRLSNNESILFLLY